MHYHQILDTAELGGGNLYALAIAERLVATGCSAPVWCGSDGPAVAEAIQRRLTIHRFDQGRLKRGSLSSLVQLASLGWRWRQWGGLVHVHSHLLYGFLRPAWRLARVRTVAHVHIETDTEAYRWAFRHPPDMIVTCAAFLAQQLDAALPLALRQQTRIVAVPNAVDTTRFFPADRAQAKERVQAPTDRPLILLAANLARTKGHLTALHALHWLRERGSDAELWFAGIERGGSTTFTDELKQRITALRLDDRVQLLGQRADMPELMRAADVVILPSVSEGLPLTLLEAQATGTPVIAAPTAGIPEIIHDGDTGFLVPADDAAGYGQRLHELFRTPALATRLAEAALQQVRAKHTFERLFQQLRSLYIEVGG